VGNPICHIAFFPVCAGLAAVSLRLHEAEPSGKKVGAAAYIGEWLGEALLSTGCVYIIYIYIHTLYLYILIEYDVIECNII